MASFEAIYGKDINAVVHLNYNMLPPSQHLSGADDRAIFIPFISADKPYSEEINIYTTSGTGIGYLEAGYIVLDNVKEGHQLSLTGKLAKDWTTGMHIDVAYT